MGNIENLNFTHPYCNNSRDAIEARKLVLQGKWNANTTPIIISNNETLA